MDKNGVASKSNVALWIGSLVLGNISFSFARRIIRRHLSHLQEGRSCCSILIRPVCTLDSPDGRFP
jgi:hypothetical protein